MNKERFRLVLNLFGEGEGGATTGENTSPAAPTGKKSGDLSNVVYGKQALAEETAPAAAEEKQGVQVTSDTLEDRRKAFREMINGEYKDVYTEEFQKAFNRRFPDYKALQQRATDTQDILDKLSARYNVMDGDISKLAKAIDNDNAYWDVAAEEAGMSVEQFKELQQMRRQNAELLRAERERQARSQADAQVQRWFQEGQQVKAKFPTFDLTSELNNPDFVRLLRAGTPMEHAYKVIHFDTLVGDAVQQTAAATEGAVVNNIRAKGARPTENGTASQSPFIVKKDVRALTRADRDEIARRVARGETISF